MPFVKASTILIIMLLISGGFLLAGYFVSDLIYGIGLWPVGAAVRVVLFIGVVAWIGFAAFGVFHGLRILIAGDPVARELQRIVASSRHSANLPLRKGEIHGQSPSTGVQMLERFFGAPKLSAAERESVLAYLKQEGRLAGKQNDAGQECDRVMMMHGASIAPGNASAEAVWAAFTKLVAAYNEVLVEHAQVKVPDAAGPYYVTWHAVDRAFVEWARAAEAAYAAIVGGLPPVMAKAKSLLLEVERLKSVSQKEQLKLMKRIRITADEYRQVFG
jgi:hypothetical protein